MRHFYTLASMSMATVRKKSEVISDVLEESIICRPVKKNYSHVWIIKLYLHKFKTLVTSAYRVRNVEVIR
jgi:hypothetical protein